MTLTITSIRLEAIIFAKRLRHLSQFSHAATDDPLGHKYVPFLVESSIVRVNKLTVLPLVRTGPHFFRLVETAIPPRFIIADLGNHFVLFV